MAFHDLCLAISIVWWYDLNARRRQQSDPAEEGAKMEMTVRKIDFKKLTFSKQPMTTAEAVKEVIPMRWPEEVCSGSRRVSMTHPQKRETGE